MNIPTCKIQWIVEPRVEQVSHTLPFMQHHSNKDCILRNFIILALLTACINFASHLKTKDPFASAFLLILLNSLTFTTIPQTWQCYKYFCFCSPFTSCGKGEVKFLAQISKNPMPFTTWKFSNIIRILLTRKSVTLTQDILIGNISRDENCSCTLVTLTYKCLSHMCCVWGWGCRMFMWEWRIGNGVSANADTGNGVGPFGCWWWWWWWYGGLGCFWLWWKSREGGSCFE